MNQVTNLNSIMNGYSEAYIRQIARDAGRDAAREEVNNNFLWERIHKLMSDAMMVTRVEEMTRTAANKIVPEVLESRIDSTTTNCLHRLFPQFISAHPMISTAMKQHLDMVNSQVQQETKNAIQKLVNDRSYDFIGEQFRKKLSDENEKRVKQQMAILKHKEEELNLALSGLNTWKAMTTVSFVSTMGMLMFLVVSGQK
jgi:hypothetical protein